jgi:pantoate--beta-alanine ligase
MQITTSIAVLRERLKTEPSVALVATMGNLHEGHLSLVKLANQYAKFVAVSVFVNRLQFGQNEDYDRYPRTLVEDCEPLEELGVDVVFCPLEKEMYPVPQQFNVVPGDFATELEGKFRPGHFSGVATVVLKLFNIVQPQYALFGKKDYQQMQVVRAMVEQLNMPIEIVAGETVRAADGFALSSRNRYLSREERAEGIRLTNHLMRIRDAVGSGNRDFAALERSAIDDLEQHGWRVDYISVRSRRSLMPPGPDDTELVVLGAAHLGRTRLIDNFEI